MNQRSLDNPSRAKNATPSPGRVLQRKCACGQHAGGGECGECRKRKQSLQRKDGVGTEPVGVPPSVHEVLRSPGRPLDPATRAFMEPRFGRNFSHVRVHTGETAAESARAVDARAYTVGPDLVFATRQYAPETAEGRRLISHELAHTIQQGGNKVLAAKRRIEISSSDSLEREADSAARAVLSGEPLPVLSGFPVGLQRSNGQGAKPPLCTGKDLKTAESEVQQVVAQAAADPAANIAALYRALKRARVCFPTFGEADFLALVPETKIYSESMRKSLASAYKGESDDRKIVWQESQKPFAGYTISGFDTANRFTSPARRRQLGSDLTPSHEGIVTFSKSAKKAQASFAEADILAFSGHQFAQYGDPGLWTNGDFSIEFDTRTLKGPLSNVKIVLSTSCATLCREAASIWKKLFPNAVFLGFKKSAPLDGSGLASSFASKLPKDLLLEAGGGGVSQAVSTWKSTVEAKFAKNPSSQPGWHDVSAGQVEVWDGQAWKMLQADSEKNACVKKG